jgi:hypothetical protein
VVVVNSNTITAKISSANNTQRGTYALTVTTSAGTSNSLGFTVQ